MTMLLNNAMLSGGGGMLIALHMFAVTALGENPPSTPPGSADPFQATSPATTPTLSAKLLRYSKRIIGKYDTNGDGVLQPDEWKSMAGKPSGIRMDQDGVITAQNYAAHVAAYGHFRQMLLLSPHASENQPAGETAKGEYESGPNQEDQESQRRNKKFFVPRSRLPKGLPQEFFNRDRDGDGQLTQAEFSPKLTATELERFKKLDANLDGVITAREYSRGPQPTKPQPDETPDAPGAKQ